MKVGRQFIGEHDKFLWLSRGDTKAETASLMTAAKYRALQTEQYATKMMKTGTANAEYVNNMATQETILCQRARYWQKNSTISDMKFCSATH